MNGPLALNRALLAYLQVQVPLELTALAATATDLAMPDVQGWLTPAVPVGQIDLWPAVMVNPGPTGRALNMVPSDDGAGLIYMKRYSPRVFGYARGSTYAETDGRRLLLGEAIWQALLADTTLGMPGVVELVPHDLSGPVPSTISAMSDKDARSIGGVYLDVTVDVCEAAPLVQPAQWAPFGDADTIDVDVSVLPFDGELVR